MVNVAILEDHVLMYYCDMRDTERTLLTIATVNAKKHVYSAMDKKPFEHDWLLRYQEYSDFTS